MKKYIILLLFAVVTISTTTAQEWNTDFEIAKKLAKANDKPIVLVFQGSDWCAPCIKLDREVWSTDEFKAYAKDHYVMLQADFPRRKNNALPEEQLNKNKALAENYNRQGIFPFVVVMNANGDVYGETSYKKLTPKKYIQELNSFIKQK
ncbi:thioredoxin family protein [Maribacter hydrothermalis]|uniref:Thiol-disulfide isomerase n=1 Tax=Maribacter hydrothermalis TaxID=1836467 RepID=A0A1B7Z000_9FLAO|nr:thioredoxin family protein [Maribacter hydrothermalis]APQ16247.1 thiol-disulfide isomerase [Maribacter hydrothermalis]OBR36065.1 thiol-disulfide isomerase [Maribacter hydrothermalis]